MLYKAKYIVTQNEDRQIISDGALVVQGSRIVEVGDFDDVRKLYPNEMVENLGNAVIMPGLINAHAHCAMSFVRGYSDDKSLMDWLFQDIFPIEARLDNSIVEIASLVSCAEMMRTGTTCFFDMYMRECAVFKAVDISGMRAVLGSSFAKFFPNDEGFTREEFFEICDKYSREWKKHPRITHAIMPHAIYTTNPEDLTDAFEFAVSHDELMGIHMSETKVETSDCIKERGMRPIEYCDSLGVLQDRTTLFHVVDVNDSDIDILKRRDCAIVHNPASNMKLASGVAPLEKFFDAGLQVGLGTDGPASNNAQNMIREMYIAALLQKVDKLDPLQSPVQKVVDMATLGSARAIAQRDSLGSIEKGKLADFFVLDLTTPNMQPVHNVLSNVVYSSSGFENKLTVINGEEVYKDGVFTKFDYNELLEEVEKINKFVKG